MSDNRLEFEVYRKTPEQVGALRELASQWVREPGGFWGFDQVIEALQRPAVRLFFLASPGENRWQAAAMVDVGPYSADLLYIFVRPEARRGGIGRLLMGQLLDWLANNPGDMASGSTPKEELLLEVRVSNLPAIALYESFGMKRVSVRKRYYANGEDALVFKHRIKP
ncbi:MAG: ribosomal-protein-alanine N-acetyltransferase [Pseudomonadota bacterium]|jgi:ribosomal-protein-alanine N-acetyltransferase